MPAQEERLTHALREVRGLRRVHARHADIVLLLEGLGRKSEALDALREAAALEGSDAAAMEALAFAAFRLNQHDIARDCYAQVTALAPKDGLARYNLASAERNLGHLDAAGQACHAALARDPGLFQAALLLSQLETQTDGSNHVGALRSSLARNGESVPAQIFLNYALGKELDDLGRYDEAFHHYGQGAGARRAILSYDVATDVAILQRIADAYSADRLAPCRKEAYAAGPYGFIIGLPRSGTTLIERLLTGHEGVVSNGETDNFSRALLGAVPAAPGDLFQRATQADRTQVASAYATLANQPHSSRLVLEKLPFNYLYAGAIAMTLPDAPILLVSRSPLDCGLAMFTTLFGAAYPFSYDLVELGRYQSAYRVLAEHWKRRLGSRLLEIPYAEFVDRPQEWGQRIATHCGLEWQPEAVRIERNQTASTTASAVQVRRPIYRSAIGRWRNYARHLAPLKQALGEFDEG